MIQLYSPMNICFVIYAKIVQSHSHNGQACKLAAFELEKCDGNGD